MSTINNLIRQFVKEALQVMPPGAESRNWDDLDEDNEGQASIDKQKEKNTPPPGEESAADKAHEMGLTHAGGAYWQDKQGKTVAKTIGTDLVKLDTDGELDKSMKPATADDLAKYSGDTQQPTVNYKTPELAKRHQTIQTAKNIETDPAIVGHIHPPTRESGDAIEVTVDGKNAVLDAWEPDYSAATVTFDDGTSKKVRTSQVSPKTPEDIKALAQATAKSARKKHDAETSDLTPGQKTWANRKERWAAWKKEHPEYKGTRDAQLKKKFPKKPNTPMASQVKTGFQTALDNHLEKMRAAGASPEKLAALAQDIKKRHFDKVSSVTGPGSGEGDVPANFDQDLEAMGVTPLGGRRAPTKDKSGGQWKRGSLADEYLKATNGDIDAAVAKIRDTLKVDNSFKARKVLGRTLRDLAARKKQIPAGPSKEVPAKAPETERDAIYQKMMNATNMADRQKYQSILTKMGAVGRPEPKPNTAMASKVPLNKMKQSDMFPEMPPVPAPGDKPTPKKPSMEPKVEPSRFDQPGTMKIPAGTNLKKLDVDDFTKRLKQLHPEFSPEQVSKLVGLFKDYQGGTGDASKFMNRRKHTGSWDLK